MNNFLKAQGQLRPFLLLVIILLLTYSALMITPSAQNKGLNSPSTDDDPYLHYLPTVISMNTNHTPAITIRNAPTDEMEIAQEDRPIADSANRGAIRRGSIIDTTEDYKALGYTDNRKLVRDEEEHLYVAYRKKWKGNYRIFIAKSTDEGEHWTVLNNGQPIESVGAYTQRVPSLAIGRNADNSANFLHLVWYGNDQEHGGNERQIKYLRLTTSGRLSEDHCCATAINVPGYAGQTLWQEHPTLYVNGSNVYIVWEGRDAGARAAKIKFVRSTDFGQTWTPPLAIAPSTTVTFSRPTLAVTYAGEQRQLYVAAYGESQGTAQIFWNRSPDNGNTWESWQPVAAGPVDQRHVSLTRDKAGYLHLVWRQVTADRSRTILRYRMFDPTLAEGAGDWTGAAQTIASRANHCLFFPSVAVDGKNQVWVIWTQSTKCHTVPNDDPTEGQILYRVKSVSGQWGNPIAWTEGGAETYATLRSAHTPSGEGVDVVWLDGSQCIGQPVSQGLSGKNEKADVAMSTGCVIRYGRIR